MSDMTPQEQLMLELINRARMDPNGEARRFGINLNEGVDHKISAKPKQVLAGNDDLDDAAGNHSVWMRRNEFSHIEQNGTPGFTGREPGDRMENAGYTGASILGENIAARGLAGIDATEAIIQQHKDLFVDKGIAGRGHRTNLLNADFQEIGIGQDTGNNTSWVTQDFARSGAKVFVTGVVYDDTVKNDDFFTVGEEQVGVAVSTGGANDTTGAGGGYELQLAANAGARTVTFGGGVSVDLTLGATNLKVDVVNDTEVWTNASLTSVSTNVTEIHLLGIGKASLHGADSGQAMYGNAGRNTFEGNGGADDFVFSKGSTGKTEKKADIITDFSQSDGDQIDLGAWDANSKQAGNQDFDFIGTEKFHGHAGDLRFLQDAGDTWIQGDTDGDRKVDLLIKLDGAVTLTAGDFQL